MKNKYFKHPALIALAVLSLASCKKDKVGEEAIEPYTVPATYNFAGVDYSSSTNRIIMYNEMNTYLGTVTSAEVSNTVLLNYWNNTGNPFTTNTFLNSLGYNLAAKTADAAVITGYMAKVASNSLSRTVPAVNGTAGFLTRVNGSKVIVGPEGMNYNQAVNKGTMGSLYFKQALDLLAAVPADDNNNPKGATPTAMQKHWDEAFGYLAVPKDYSPDLDYTVAPLSALVFPAKPGAWGGYLAERGKQINAGKTLFDAFLKGRAAIGAKDYKVRDEAIATIKTTWERLDAISALAYVILPQKSDFIGKKGDQFGYISEGYGFIIGLKFRPSTSKLTEANYQKLVSIFTTNYYTLVDDPGLAKLKEAESILRTTYDLQNVTF
ncbi:DUF4856 domain-containing protein [Pedobacter jeongneungensis]|uniref:DUF4856 domain-containing protein n=1 Tax=Pedobacter jeongneungensis TaxID=947309 RepID=A0ABP8BRK8_9SPHI